jgi:hypothetical protein
MEDQVGRCAALNARIAQARAHRHGAYALHLVEAMRQLDGQVPFRGFGEGEVQGEGYRMLAKVKCHRCGLHTEFNKLQVQGASKLCAKCKAAQEEEAHTAKKRTANRKAPHVKFSKDEVSRLREQFNPW